MLNISVQPNIQIGFFQWEQALGKELHSRKGRLLRYRLTSSPQHFAFFSFCLFKKQCWLVIGTSYEREVSGPFSTLHHLLSKWDPGPSVLSLDPQGQTVFPVPLDVTCLFHAPSLMSVQQSFPEETCHVISQQIESRKDLRLQIYKTHFT